ncbi:MAG: amidophosphoribosyltransferase [Bacteriovoracaceae bacterium]|nr:amidophosphoribosyltransferase [Bacteriovoracaceae bacterium]
MCGIVGIIGSAPVIADNPDSRSWAASETCRGLLTLQHRGQDSAGILSYDTVDGRFHGEKQKGLITSVFTKDILEKLKGDMAIAHTRYVTTGSDDNTNLQPIVTGIPYGIGMVHNGNILNYHELRKSLHEKRGIQLITNNDVELILALWCQNMIKSGLSSFSFRESADALKDVFETLKGAWSVTGIIAGKGLFAFRDPMGIRPLAIGKRISGGKTSFCITSETVAMNFLGYEFIRDVYPGEFIFIDIDGQFHNTIIRKEKSHTPCMFEWVYFSGAESEFEGKSVYSARLALGKLLALKIKKYISENRISPDVVVPVPDTSRTAAIGVAEHLGLPYREALIKNRYVYRSFILGSQEKREKAVELKLSPVKSEIRGKNILLVDDSIVRGTTSKKIINLLKRYGALEVTLASTCPPIRFPCFYGIDFPSREELIASRKDVSEIANAINAREVIYMDETNLMEALGRNNLCMACLNNKYPTDIKEGENFASMRKIETTSSQESV